MALDGSCGPFNNSTVSEATGAGAARSSPGWFFTPNFRMICATLDSIAFSVVTTFVMRWPVMSWKLQAS